MLVIEGGDARTKAMVGLQIAIAVVLAMIYGLAAKGLYVGKPWGRELHIVGACLAALTCFGVAYTVLGLVLAMRADVKMYAQDDHEDSGDPHPDARDTR
jgi:hypothetical protein